LFDLHSHILPDVDDGPKTVEATLEMAKAAAEGGTAVMLATPHRKDVTENSSVEHLRDLLADVSRRMGEDGTDLTLVLGMENHLDMDLPAEVSSGRALPMNGSRYILVEMPFFGRPNYIEDVLFQLQLQGTVPVLAHPERIEAFQREPDLLVRFVERGMLSQITAGSVVGHFGGRARRFTNTLLRRRLVHVIASDTHFPRGPRSPDLLRGVAAAARIVGEERARAMVVDTPKAILDDRAIDVEPPTEAGATRRWWWLWG
jgi:protein-tyrosine phosphatase